MRPQCGEDVDNMDNSDGGSDTIVIEQRDAWSDAPSVTAIRRLLSFAAPEGDDDGAAPPPPPPAAAAAVAISLIAPQGAADPLSPPPLSLLLRGPVNRL